MVDLISGMNQEFIKFPDPDSFERVEMKFRHKFGFPGVLGCVDGTHIPVLVPKNNKKRI